MGLLQKLKSALGLNGAESSRTAADNVDVTVEREPATEAEDAVKGTETAASSEADTTPVDAASDDRETAESDSSSDTAESSIEDRGESVTEIKGIGPAYAERLSRIGIETVDQLAAADAADIAAQTDLGEGRVSDWVERATDY